ncbi:hypothetical protein PCC7424_1736 [Gloeothece citriformis PCC 7424]|uniref:Uncharacterized protein n=1 Tax=Gloeothece citriformis (strain PCC 7424) TaxID=65393 RepID=B7KB61_GLOC7|nr:hypothetical protein [Gloeothece citriformis]ACK70171.1 hypothetical protein PCC7424_1736 [Gloeothece citriformis PCC 7424]
MVFERPQKRASQQPQGRFSSQVFQRQYFSDEEEKQIRNRPMPVGMFNYAATLPTAPYSEPIQEKADNTKTDDVSVEESININIPVVQLVKTEKDRSDKQKRVANAKKTINLLGNNMKNNLDNHLFNAKPSDGGAINQNAPVGLHAYTDGRLPNGVVNLATVGSLNKVHTLTWRWQNSVNQKNSTMFPQWMPPAHVRTLITLQYADTRDQTIEAGEQLYPADTKTYIQRGLNINLHKAGDTVYPEL